MKPSRYLLYITVFVTAITSCKKTDTIAPPALSTTRVIEYKIVNVQGDPIFGSINDNNKTITLYLPYYILLKTLIPEIKIVEGSTISPASGTLVTDLAGLFKSNGSVDYTITDKAGKKETYRLLIKVQQPDITISEFTTNPASPATLKPGALGVMVNGTEFVTSADKSLTKIYLVDAAGKETDTDPDIKYTYAQTTTMAWCRIPPNMPEGLYRIRIYSYSKSATTINPVRIAN